MKKFKTFLQKIAPISDKEFDDSMLFFRTLTLKKGDFFVQKDSICKQIGFISDGIVRIYYTNENGEKTTSGFCSENNLTTSYKSFIQQLPSNLVIQALSETTLLAIGYKDLQALYAQSTTWQTIGRTLTEREYLVMEKYASVLNNETAKTKYLRFMKEHPDIMRSVPVNYIASYLGVTRRTLSRIRQEVSKPI
jgi:CRP-like cAMP-binding protein